MKKNNLPTKQAGDLVPLELGINEPRSDYLQFWRDKRTIFGYFKLDEISAMR